MKLLYFAWVRERIGKAEEQVDPPAGVDTVGELMAWLARRDEQYAYAFAESESDPRRHRPQPCARRCQDRGRERDRVLSADDRRVSERC